MSGHSKWSSIKHKKAATDAKRGKAFTRIIRELTIAAKTGGSDPGGNPRLRTAIAAAKDVNMPLRNIESAVKKGSGEQDGVDYEEITYEGYGPGGVAILVDTATDNRNRTASEVRHAFSKYNGSLGAVGSVSYLFAKKGIITVTAEGVNEDVVMEAGLEAGAEDVKSEDGFFLIETAPNDVADVREKMEAAGIKVESGEVTNIPSMTKAVEGKEGETLVKLLNALDELDDVVNLSANFDLSDELMELLQ